MKTILILSLASGAFISPVLALNDASFVASSGSDANDCSRATPCRLFQRAHDQTNVNGIVTALDPADYGILSITKAITIDGNGGGRGIRNGAITGILINAPGGAV